MGRVAIVVPTHNRPASLRRTILSVLAQLPGAPGRDLIVVDNNSTAETHAVCAELTPSVRYVAEPRQGLSFARNTGIASSGLTGHDDVIAFIDDDVEAAPGWLAALRAAFEAHPGVDCVGGRVLPAAPAAAMPAWLTREHWSPLALQDHGASPQMFDETRPAGLIGANFAFRADVFERIGGFSPRVQRVKDGVGSTEDHELLRRLYAAGGRALYVPDAVVRTDVPQERLTRAYHRRWHSGHGRFHAIMRTPETERTRGRIAGVPLHLFRGAVRDSGAWLRSALSRDAARAFAAETRLWFFSGFLRERCAWLMRR
jgi:glycosyltransferase involved in cell wall biosynthesis